MGSLLFSDNNTANAMHGAHIIVIARGKLGWNGVSSKGLPYFITADPATHEHCVTPKPCCKLVLLHLRVPACFKDTIIITAMQAPAGPT